MAIISAAILALYGVFLFVQTVRHREDFLDREADAPASEKTRPLSRKVVLASVVLLPVSLPALLMMVQATTGVLTGDLDAIQIRTWITQLAGYDIIYTTVCILLFETVLNAE